MVLAVLVTSNIQVDVFESTGRFPLVKMPSRELILAARAFIEAVEALVGLMSHLP